MAQREDFFVTPMAFRATTLSATNLASVLTGAAETQAPTPHHLHPPLPLTPCPDVCVCDHDNETVTTTTTTTTTVIVPVVFASGGVGRCLPSSRRRSLSAARVGRDDDGDHEPALRRRGIEGTYLREPGPAGAVSYVLSLSHSPTPPCPHSVPLRVRCAPPRGTVSYTWTPVLTCTWAYAVVNR